MTSAFANRPLVITVGGAELDAELARCASSAIVRQALGAPTVAEVAFAEPPAGRGRVFAYGSEIELRLDLGAVLFRGEITTLEWQCDGASGRILRVRAYDELHRLRKTQRARTLADVTAGDVVRQAAGELGLDSAISEDGPPQTLAVQYEQSDLEFITELAGRSGLYVYLDGRTLRLLSLAGSGNAIPLALGRELATANATATAETVRRASHARAWNVLRTTAQEGDARTARQDAEEMHALDLTAFGNLGERTLYNRVAAGVADAVGVAQDDLDRATAGEVSVTGAADGDPALRPGAIVAISGVDDAVDGRFALTRVLHRFSAAEGYITEFSTAPPRRASRGRDPVFTFGIVFDVDDPERLSRVRARLPLLGDLDSAWMPVMLPGAGAHKGFCVMPERDDKVLIVFPDGNPAYGIVLGGLAGEAESPGVASGPPRSYVLRTGNGQTLTLDAANEVARLETSGGDALELGPKGSRLHAARDLLIEAPGRTLTIRAAAVEFEKG